MYIYKKKHVYDVIFIYNDGKVVYKIYQVQVKLAPGGFLKSIQKFLEIRYDFNNNIIFIYVPST